MVRQRPAASAPAVQPGRRRLLLRLPGLLTAGLAGCGSLQPARVGVLDRVIATSRWGGTPAQLPAEAQRITHITIHHQGELWDPGADVPAYLRRLQDWSRKARGWTDIPYHWVVAPDGAIYAARPWQIAGDTNTEYDPRGHLLVMLLGNFEIQYPTAAQWDAAVELVAGLQQEFGVAGERIATHRDHSGGTVCPGVHLYERFAEFQAAVQQSAR